MDRTTCIGWSVRQWFQTINLEKFGGFEEGDNPQKNELPTDNESFSNHDACPSSFSLRTIRWKARVKSVLSGGVTVAQGPLEAFVLVRIQAGQPLKESLTK